VGLSVKLATHYGFICPCTVNGVVRTTYTDSVWAIKRTKNTVHGHGIKTEELDFLSVFGVWNEQNRRLVLFEHRTKIQNR
jgi:hypothetical protein